MRQLHAAWAKELLATHLVGDGPRSNQHDISIRGPLPGRYYSRVFQVDSPAMPSPGVLKVCLKPHSTDPDAASARQQFNILRQLNEAAPAEGRALAPRPYLLVERDGAILAEWIPGGSMSEQLFSWKCSAADALVLVGKAAKWLRRFHSVQALGQDTLDVQSKLLSATALADRGFRGDPTYDRCLACLSKWAAQAGAIRLQRSWVHGDFKASNLLLHDGDVVGIDIHAASNSVVIYDMAHFLNDIELSPLYSLSASERHERLDAYFVETYFGRDQPDARLPLLWVRTYMQLSQWHTVKEELGDSFRGRALQRRYRHAVRRAVRRLECYA